MARADHYNDPDAPRANSLVPWVTAAVRDEQGRLLLIHEADLDLWALPGGAMRLGETVADGAVREVEERTGIRIEITDLVGLYSSPGHVVVLDGGEVCQEFNVCFHARPLDSTPRASGPTAAAVRWAEIEELDQLPIHPAVRIRINDALNDLVRPRIA